MRLEYFVAEVGVKSIENCDDQECQAPIQAALTVLLIRATVTLYLFYSEQT
jgi:hypothetical protein